MSKYNGPEKLQIVAIIHITIKIVIIRLVISTQHVCLNWEQALDKINKRIEGIETHNNVTGKRIPGALQEIK